jgi:hypothetical protein
VRILWATLYDIKHPVSGRFAPRRAPRRKDWHVRGLSREILTLKISRVHPLVPFILFLIHPQTLILLHRVLLYVQQTRAQLQAHTGRLEPNPVQLSVHKQLESMLETSPLKFEDLPQLFQQLEEHAAKITQGLRRILEQI